MAKSWTANELMKEIGRFEAELRAAGKKDQTIHTYIDRAQRFVRWLDGAYDPKEISTGRYRLDAGTRLRSTRSHR